MKTFSQPAFFKALSMRKGTKAVANSCILRNLATFDAFVACSGTLSKPYERN